MYKSCKIWNQNVKNFVAPINMVYKVSLGIPKIYIFETVHAPRTVFISDKEFFLANHHRHEPPAIV